jgi:hypothetical protein
VCWSGLARSRADALRPPRKPGAVLIFGLCLSPPFPLNGIRGLFFQRADGAVKGARCFRVHRSKAETLDGEDGPHTLVSEGKGVQALGPSGYRSMPWSCAVCNLLHIIVCW